jgi:hypothetical protein
MNRLRRLLISMCLAVFSGPPLAGLGPTRSLHPHQPTLSRRHRGAGKPGTPGNKLARRALEGRLGVAAIR